jgi:hypothetical protein
MLILCHPKRCFSCRHCEPYRHCEPHRLCEPHAFCFCGARQSQALERGNPAFAALICTAMPCLLIWQPGLPQSKKHTPFNNGNGKLNIINILKDFYQ